MEKCTVETASELDDEEDSEERLRLLQQINELQDAVREMKTAFTTAVHQLGAVQYGDQDLRDKVNHHRTEYQEYISQVIKLILSLKTEFMLVKSQIQLYQENQTNLSQCVQNLFYERDLLLEELLRTGSVAEDIKKKLHSPGPLVIPRGGTQSTQSNDSGVALLLEKAHSSFHPTCDPECSSLPDQQPGVYVSSLVRDYVEGLTSRDKESFQDPHEIGSDCELLPTPYDSDSSLTIAANKSLCLSASLGKKCGLDLEQFIKNKPDQSLIQEQDPSDVIPSSPGPDGLLFEKDAEDDKFQEVHRFRIATEFLDTERKYCKTLLTLQDIFANPMRESGILEPKDLEILFPKEVYEMYEKHCTLLQQLEDRILIWNTCPNVGDILARFTDSKDSHILRLYTCYVNDFPDMLATFHRLCRSSQAFAKFLKQCLEHPNCGGLDLGAFLLTPVQRIPRYILLLKQLLRHTPSRHPDLNNITECLHRLRDYLEKLNDSMEHNFQLVAAQMPPEDLRDSRGNRLSKAKQSIFLKADHIRRSLTPSDSSDSSAPESLYYRAKYISKNSRDLDNRLTNTSRFPSVNSDDSKGYRSSPRTSPSEGPSKSKATPRSRSGSVSSVSKRSNLHNMRHSCVEICQEPLDVSIKEFHEEEQVQDSSKLKPQPLPRKKIRKKEVLFGDNELKSLKKLNSRKHYEPVNRSLQDCKELACSEPSLNESTAHLCTTPGRERGPEKARYMMSTSNIFTRKSQFSINRPLSSAHSVQNIHNADTQYAINFHSILAELDKKSERKKTDKKKSIKTSLKNIFSFKKRGCSRTLHINEMGSDYSYSQALPCSGIVMTQYEQEGEQIPRNVSEV